MSKYALATIPDGEDGRLVYLGGLDYDMLDGAEKFDYWHPDLPEVGILESRPTQGYPLDVAFRHPSTRTWLIAMPALLLSLLLPLAAHAAPCTVNVQTCSPEQCAYLPGIGPAKGAAISTAHPADEAALDAVPGIGEATLSKIRPYVTYTGETTCTGKQTAPKPEAGKDGAR